jgi:carboxypeptidase Taq
MSDNLNQLKARFNQTIRLSEAARLLSWDQQTYMPSAAAAGRAEQAATISQIAHELSVSDEMCRLLERCEADLRGQPDDSDDVRMLQVIRRQYDLNTKLPATLMAEVARHQAIAHACWQRARAANDFSALAPALEKMFDLARQGAEYLGYSDHIYDALIDIYEPGMKYADVAAMFSEIKPRLTRLVYAIAASKVSVDDSLLRGSFPVDQQKSLTQTLVGALGYDLARGRIDEAAHPFCSSSGREDVRITTRYNPELLPQGLYASIHEAGHAMYEQGSPAKFEGTALAGAASTGFHESQSRLWENLVGRSRAFCQFIYPFLVERFPGSFASGGEELLYRAVNRVTPTMIRVEADEVTYNLHVLIRFELESEMLAGTLNVSDLPDAWNSRMESYLGITPSNDAEGVLQDVHWSGGLIGYFPTYTIGNLLSGQLWHAIGNALPNLPEQISRGEFAPLLEWLRVNVHQYGQKYRTAELIEMTTGEPLSAHYFVDYLTAKYSEIYRL